MAKAKSTKTTKTTKSSKKRSSGFDIVLFLITFFLGWFGIDKLYKGSVKLCLIKLVLNLIVVGMIWNIYDIVCILIGRYKMNPLK